MSHPRRRDRSLGRCAAKVDARSAQVFPLGESDRAPGLSESPRERNARLAASNDQYLKVIRQNSPRKSRQFGVHRGADHGNLVSARDDFEDVSLERAHLYHLVQIAVQEVKIEMTSVVA